MTESKCDGVNHRAEVDVVTFIEQPDQIFRTLIMGDVETIRSKVQEMERDKSPNASVYIDYCCDACKEMANES
jgi:hypothetical protein